jgi:hypothetical protein
LYLCFPIANHDALPVLLGVRASGDPFLETRVIKTIPIS